MLPAHWPRSGDDMLVNVASIVVTATTGIIGWFAFLNVATLCRATLLARDPVPVRPEPGQRVAFLTTIVPEAESLELVRPTLEAALRIRHDGELDVWLLDEGDDPDVRRMCRARRQPLQPARVERWNRPKGPHRARTKHGNYNAWLDAHGERYDFMLGVDPDHVPLPNFAERLLGYFRSGRGFVVGPQVYGNYEGFVVRSAESQQFLFHSLLQRAGNGSRTPMLVGTNNALRVSALRQIGGFQDSITEDMATSVIFHTTRNPETKRCDLGLHARRRLRGRGAGVVHGLLQPAGPLVARDRRGAGAPLLAMAHRLGPRAMVHYLLLTAYYPTAAIAWILGAVNAILYFALAAVVAGAPVADALRGRRGAPDRPLLLQPAPQRQPAREEGLGGRGRDADLSLVGADLRGLARRRGAAALARLRDDAQGRREHARHADHVPQARALGARLRCPAAVLVRPGPPPLLDARLVARVADRAPCRWRSGGWSCARAARGAAREPQCLRRSASSRWRRPRSAPTAALAARSPVPSQFPSPRIRSGASTCGRSGTCRASLCEEPLEPAAFERRKRHEVVRRSPARR